MNGNWQCIGASVIGPGHIRNNMPNQDAWAMKQTALYDCVVVADGLGSKQKSDIASRGICQAVIKASDWFVAEKASHDFDASEYLLKAITFFEEEVSGFSRQDCATTCLLGLRLNGKVYLAMLGDGLLAVQMKNGELVYLEDDKLESFSNMVSALFPNADETNWLFRELNEEDCLAIFLCTDGVSDDLENKDGFVKDFVASFTGMNKKDAETSIIEILEHWPVPKHSDDKTIVCLYRGDVKNE